MDPVSNRITETLNLNLLFPFCYRFYVLCSFYGGFERCSSPHIYCAIHLALSCEELLLFQYFKHASMSSVHPPPSPTFIFAFIFSLLVFSLSCIFMLSPNGYSDVSESVVVERTCCHGDAAMHKAPRAGVISNPRHMRTVIHLITRAHTGT